MINLEFCDSPGKEIFKSNEMKLLEKLIPDWAEIIKKALNYDETETYRTIRHVFRSLWTYFMIINRKFKSNIKDENIISLYKDLKRIFDFHPDLFPMILLYHDIGRPFNREWHTFESAKIIQQEKILENSEFTPIEQKILIGVIRHHLLPGTIFTGESSYYGASVLYNDTDLKQVWLSYNNIDIFFHILMVFTIIDIWGYDYSKIFDHYFPHYLQIRDNLIRVFAKIDFIEQKDHISYLFQELSNLDNLNLKWRIACSLRIFQFVNTQPYLTEEFYYTKLYEGLKASNQDWESFANSLGNKHSLIQFKYALPIMMVLASENFARKPFNPEEKILHKIFDFWKICSTIVKSLEKDNQTFKRKSHLIWNFIFNFPRGWFLQSKHLKYVLSDLFLSDIEKSPIEYNSEMEWYLVNIK